MTNNNQQNVLTEHSFRFSVDEKELYVIDTRTENTAITLCSKVLKLEQMIERTTQCRFMFKVTEAPVLSSITTERDVTI